MKTGKVIQLTPQFVQSLRKDFLTLMKTDSKIAARPIKLNRGEIKKVAERLLKQLQKKGRGKEEETVGVHSTPLASTTFQVDTVMGMSIPMTVALASKRGPGNVGWVLGGGFGHHKRTGTPYVILFLDGSLTWKALTGNYMVKEIFTVLMHELTHAADRKKLAPDYPSEADVDPSEYYNDPQEVRAFMREIYEEIREMVLKMHAHPSLGWNLGKIIESRLRSSATWKQVEPHLTRKNRNKMLKGITTAIQDEMNQKRGSQMNRLASLYVTSRKVASKYVQAAGDMQTLHYAQAWMNKFINSYLSAADDGKSAYLEAKKVEMYVSPTGAAVTLSLPEGFPQPDTGALSDRFTDVQVKTNTVRPSGWHVSHPIVSSSGLEPKGATLRGGVTRSESDWMNDY